MENWWNSAPIFKESEEEGSAPQPSPKPSAVPATAATPSGNWWDAAPVLDTAPKAPERGIGAGLARNADITGQFIGSNIESLGDNLGLEGVSDYGRSMAARNKAELAAKGPGMTSSDIDGAGSLGTFVGEKFSESATPMVTGIGAATAAGAAAGALFGGVGAIPGALIGLGAATLANLPYFFGSHRERQKDADIAEGRKIEVDDGAALAYALPASALDSVYEVFMIGKLGKVLKPALNASGKSLLTRVTTNAATGATTESLTELGQTVIERHQAGLSLTDQEAQDEYYEAMVAGGLLGAAGGGVTGAVPQRVAPSTNPTVDPIPDAGGTPDQTLALSGQTVPSAPQSNQVDPDVAAALTRSKLAEIRAKREARADGNTLPTQTIYPDVAAANQARIDANEAAKKAAADETARVARIEAETKAEALKRKTPAEIRAEKIAARKTPPPAPSQDLTPEQRVAANKSLAAELTDTLTQPRPAATVAPATPAPAPQSDLINTLSQERPVTPEVAPAPVAPAPTVQVENPTEQVASTPIVEPAPEPVEQEVASGDDVPTVPETPEQIKAQMAALVDPKDARGVVFVPNDGFMPSKPEGNFVGIVRTKDGVLFYNSRKKLNGQPLNKARVKIYEVDGRRNELLGLGPFNKAEVVANGEADRGVVERTPEGVAVKEVAANEETAPEQIQALEELAPEGNTIEVAPAEEVIAERQAAPVVTPKVAAIKETSQARAPAPVAKPKKVNAAEKQKANREKLTNKLAPFLAKLEHRDRKDAEGKPAIGYTVEEVLAMNGRAAKPITNRAIALMRKPKGVYWDKANSKSMIEFIDDTGEYVTREATAAEVSASYDVRTAEADKAAAEKAKKDTSENNRGDRKEGVLAQANRGELSPEEEITSRISPQEMKHNPKRTTKTLDRFRDAAKLFTETAPETAEEIRALADAVPVFERFKKTLTEAKARGIVIGKQVSDDVTNAVAWLIQMQTMSDKMESFATARPATQKTMLGDLMSFIANEQILVATADSTALREDRKAFSEAITNSYKGSDAEGIADANAVMPDDTDGTTNEEESDAEDKVVTSDADETSNDDVQDTGGLSSVAMDTEEDTSSEEDDDYGIPDEPMAAVEAPVIDEAIPTYTAGTSKTPVVEVRKKRTVTLPGNIRRGEGLGTPEEKTEVRDTLDLVGVPYYDDALDNQDRESISQGIVPETVLAEDVTSMGELAKVIDTDEFRKALITDNKLLSKLQAKLQSAISSAMYNSILNVIGDVRVYILSDEDFNRLAGTRANGYYMQSGDFIAIRKSTMADSNAMAHILIHEGAHAAFEHAIDANPEIARQLETLRIKAEAHAIKTGFKGSKYGFQDMHEFLSEAFSNPVFQEFLATVPLSFKERIDLSLRGAKGTMIKDAMAWLRAKLGDILGIDAAFKAAGYKGASNDMLRETMFLAGRIMELAPQARADAYGTGTIRPSEGEFAKGSYVGKLKDRGLNADVAARVAQVIDEEFDGKVTDEELDVLALSFMKPNTGTITPGGNIPVPPRIAKAFEDKPGRVWMGGSIGRLLLKMMTLDGISRRGRTHFADKTGNAMTEYENSALEHDTIRRQVEEAHYEDFAAYEELRRSNPQAAEKLANLIGDLAAIDVNLGPNANNKHLEGNARKNLQAKSQLPAVQADYDALKASHPEAIELMHTMADHYRESFNQHIRAVTYNILAGLDTKLSNSDLMRIMENAVEGKLTNQDELDVNNPAVFGFLRKSEKLRTRKGLYFPSVRFGNVVVQTTSKVKPPPFTSAVTRARSRQGTAKAGAPAGGKNIPLKVEVKGSKVSVSFDHTVRGANPAVTKKLYDWVAQHELPLASYVVRYRNRATGEVVGKGDMDITQDYDMVHEIQFQNEGVHFFESRADAVKFYDEAKKEEAAGNLEFVKGIMDAHETSTDNLVGADKSSLDGVMRALKDGGKLSEGQMNLMASTMRQAITMQLAGNRFEKRLLGRKNVAGASKEVGRAAAIYGRSVGNAVAGAMSGQTRREALERMKGIASKENDPNRAVNELRSQIVNELVLRENLEGQPMGKTQLLNDLMTVNSIDKLASPANWLLNSTQVAMSTGPVLGGRFGNAKAAKAIGSAYKRIGAVSTVTGGLKNTAKGVTSWGKTQIDPENLLDSIRTKLGPKYKDLLDTMVSRGDVSEGVGIENAEQFSAGRGAAGMALAKVDRIARQMPNAIEAINRTVTAVSAYDLARESGMSHQEAIQFATDTLRRTQFRYDAVNTPRLMQENRAFKFFFTFKKFGFGQYQLFLEMVDQAFNGASLEERKIAGKQLGNLLAMQAVTAGVFSLPGTEIIKTAVILGAVLGLTDGWDDWVEWLRGLMEESVGKDMAQIFSKGLVSKAAGVDLSSRMSWADLITGFPPGGTDQKSVWEWVGRTLAGAPGTMPFDMAMGAKQFVDGAINDSPKDMWKGISAVVPVKIISDATKAVEGVRSGNMTGADAAKQVLGFKSLAQSDKSDQTGVSIRANTEKKKTESKLVSNYLSARSRADVLRATSAIRKYNQTLTEDQREISIPGLEKKRRADIRASN